MNQFGGSGSQFGGGAGPDDYGFFAPTRSGGTTTSAFGSAPAATGAPGVGTMGGFGGEPYATSSAPASPRNGLVKKLGAVLVIAVLAVAGWFGWIRYQLSRPLTTPSSLSAMQPVDVQRVRDVKGVVEQEWHKAYPGRQLAVEVYSGHKQAAILAMARGSADIEKDFADAGFRGSLQPVGHAQCAQIQDGLVGCERSSRTLSALVLFFGGTAHDAAAALDEAWQQQ